MQDHNGWYFRKLNHQKHYEILLEVKKSTPSTILHPTSANMAKCEAAEDIDFLFWFDIFEKTVE